MKAVVLVSGGIDSTVALWWAKERYRVAALSFQTPYRPRGEERACAAILARAGVAHVQVPLPFLEVRAGGYVPGRNLVFHAAALSIAESRAARVVVAGHNASDAEHFPDARPAFFRGVQTFARNVTIELPFSTMTDDQVVALGLRLGAPIESSWSCYRDEPRPCGRCPACRDRRAAFRKARGA